jgi:hypothetical protein
MAIETSLERLPEGHPDRCKNTGNGQHCSFRRVGESAYCQVHNGTVHDERVQRDNVRAYKISKWKTQLDRFYNDPNIKTLREEIAIARMTLEAIINRCEDQNDLLMNSTRIQVLLGEINRLVVSCNKLEDRLGMVLDRSAVLILAEQIVQVIALELPEQKAESITGQIINIVTNVATPVHASD